MKVNPVAILAGVVAGILSVGLAWRTTAQPRLEHRPFAITRASGMRVTPERPLIIGQRFGDFTLNCRVELPAGADLDLLFRKVEHWGDVEGLPLFHSRFAGIRMSTRKQGPGLLTREQILFGDDHGDDFGGVMFAAGQPASLELECKGQRVEATVNGVELEPITTIDAFGNFALVCRQGTALVQDFKITAWPSTVDTLPWWVGGLAGLVFGLLIGLLGASAAWTVFGLIVFASGGALADAMVFEFLLPAVPPSSTAVAYGAVALWPLAALLLVQRLGFLPRLLVALLVGVPAAYAILELCARTDFERMAIREDERLDLTFGKESGTATFDAVARMLSCRYQKHTLIDRRYDVLLLGGQTFFDFDDSIEGSGRNVGAALPALLRTKLRQSAAVTVAATSTGLPNAYQQTELYARYYKDYRPKVVVLGLCNDEDDVHQVLRLPPRLLAVDLAKERPAPGSYLWAIRASKADPTGPPQDGPELQKTLEELRRICVANDAKLVLVLDQSLSQDKRAAAVSFCLTNKLAFVQGFDIYAGRYPVDALAEQVRDELIR